MRKLTCITSIIMSLFFVKVARAQDPSFSQFFSSPLNINPALTANINADWKIHLQHQGPVDRTCESVRNGNGVVR